MKALERFAEKLLVSRLASLNSSSRLHREAGDSRCSEVAVGGKDGEIGGDAGSRGGIEPCDRQKGLHPACCTLNGVDLGLRWYFFTFFEKSQNSGLVMVKQRNEAKIRLYCPVALRRSYGFLYHTDPDQASHSDLVNHRKGLT